MPASISPSQNVELKARLRSVEQARETARQVATDYLGWEHQVDTYFHCARGRLKLREIDGKVAQLVGYMRPDETGPKLSNYRLTAIQEPASLKQTLTDVLGVLTIVDKQREIFLHHNVRIHLDQVASLGTFLEFEAVLSAEIGEVEGRSQIAFLSNRFAVRREDLLSASYLDMILLRTKGIPHHPAGD